MMTATSCGLFNPWLQKRKYFFHVCTKHPQKHPLRGVPRKRCSENMQQIYSRTPMPKCDFNKIASILVKNLQAEKALLEQQLDEEKQRSSSRQEYINALRVSDKLPKKVQKQPSRGVLRKRCSENM